MTHPKYQVPRTYKVTVNGKVSEENLNILRKGIQLDDGFSGTSRASFLSQSEGNSIIRLTITQGRNRLVRRMMDALGYNVVHLIRTGFGNLELGNLRLGSYRYLDPDEIKALKDSVGLKS